jgi:radical SAM superfamily enzyme YgiQ (UPF0313 family)
LSKLLLITPPFTQLNTPYPATAYLKGFLDTKNVASFQVDLGIELILRMFCKRSLYEIFSQINHVENYSENAQRIYDLRDQYEQTIDSVILFLQGKNSTNAYAIAGRNYLPEASRFDQLQEADLQFSFGNMGHQDKAKYIATLYLEDLSDFIKECIDEHFGFSRYAERLARSADKFDELNESLQQELSWLVKELLVLLEKHIAEQNPTLICFSAPFPGNIFSAFKCAQFIKQKFPHIPTALGGGFANTELRSLTDVRVFEYFDFITLDDGEKPIEQLVAFTENKISKDGLKRTFLLEDNAVKYYNAKEVNDYSQMDLGTPNYDDFLLDQYISAIEITNPMHSLWSNGRWNKLTMAHGCYWGKCTFCDISLPYIAFYEPVTASLIVDRMASLIASTGESGFHFVDEAAPPALMRAVSLELIKRKINVTWWANIRFEKSFTRDLCILFKESGCIGVSGGLEVASDRLLKLIDKGITIAQVAQVNKNFTQAGIMVHAYLMYGFPTQTAQETIDSLEVVRQLFESATLQSAFWHQFAMTAHSPVGLEPEKYKVKKETEQMGTFANNDIVHHDPTGTEHELFSEGLKKSLFNYMNGIGFDWSLNKWFDHKVPSTSIRPDYISSILNQEEIYTYKPSQKVFFHGVMPKIELVTKSKKGQEWNNAHLHFTTKKGKVEIKLPQLQGEWLYQMLPKLTIANEQMLTMEIVRKDYERYTNLGDFDLFWANKPMNAIEKIGVLVFS